ncbi:MAG: sigma-70 family RNA polymerase sigma factor [Acetobacteraceae bacterium]|nr:sigma-70 family RNA polymerase sigma factor [Acetobacteraceae bacterium]
MNDEHSRARFEGLMVPLMKDAHNLARWLMRNEEEAQGAVQEAYYLRAFRFSEGFHLGTNARRWLLPIVRNACYTALSARQRQKAAHEPDLEALEDAAPGPRASLETKATVEAVRAAIAALPVDYREVVVLREREGLSYREIAEVAGIPLGTVMSRLWRVRDQLHRLLQERKAHDRL